MTGLFYCPCLVGSHFLWVIIVFKLDVLNKESYSFATNAIITHLLSCFPLSPSYLRLIKLFPYFYNPQTKLYKMRKFNRLVFVPVLLGTILSCTPKTTETLTESPEPEPVIVQEEEVESLTPCRTFADIANRDEVETAFVLYRDQMKLKDPAKAYPLWQVAMHSAPGSNGRVQYHFEDGLRIFKHFFDKSTDSLEQRKWLDSIEWVYDKRAECFGDEAYLAGRKAFDYYYYYRKFVSQDTIYSLFKKAVDGKKEKSDYFVVNPFVKILDERFKDSLIDFTEAQYYAYQLLDILDYGTKNCKGGECQAWEIINEYAPNLLENFEGEEGFYDCNYYTKKYYQLFLQNPDDCDVVNNAYRQIDRKSVV